MGDIYSFTVKKSDGSTQAMDMFKGKALLIVNVASKCGFTPQYEGLEALYQEFREKGLVVLGFPCNQFGHQEPGTDDEIQNFCKLNYDVNFPVMAKIEVNGDNADPLYKWLKASAPGIMNTEAIKWNFTKFLINRRGQVVERFAPQTKPSDIADSIQKVLAEA